MRTLWQDVRYGVRMLVKNPGFTAVAVLTFALGIGGTTAIFGMMSAYILDPVPLQNERWLIEINEFWRPRQLHAGLSAPLCQELVQQRDLFAEVVSFAGEELHIPSEEFLDTLPGQRVSPNFFRLFRTPLLRGRWLTKEEQEAAVENVLVISYATWQTRFGGDPEVIGKTLRTGDATYTIIGVMPAHFQFPSRYCQYWRPLRFGADELSTPGQRSHRQYFTFALLAPDVSQSQAQVFLDTLTKRLAGDFPQQWQDFALQSRPLRDLFVAPEIQKILWCVALAIGFVLVIVCATWPICN